MKFSAGVKVDCSFAELAIQYLNESSEELLHQICNHLVAGKIISNAQVSSQTPINARDFWKKILEKEKSKGEDYIHETRNCISYIDENTESLYAFIDELYSYLPEDFTFDCNLYLHIGYDIGIVAEGDALLNVGHPIFHKNKRELLYFALHELHHVGFTKYIDTLRPFSEIKTARDFLDLLERLTHLEGTSTYSIKEIREREKQPLFFDYEVLNDNEKREQSVQEYFEIYNRFKNAENLPIKKDDFNFLEVMSGKRKRLWYVVGAHMAEEIDKNLGREALNKTILEGSKSFFEKYFAII